MRILGRILDTILAEYSAAWAPIAALQCTYSRTEVNPAVVSIAGPDDMVLVMELTCDLGCGAAKLHLGIPYAMLEPVRVKLNEAMHHGGGADCLDRQTRRETAGLVRAPIAVNMNTLEACQLVLEYSKLAPAHRVIG